MFVDDAEHAVVGGPGGPLRGKTALRSSCERRFPDLEGKSVEPVRRPGGDSFLIDETTRVGKLLDGRAFGLGGMSGEAPVRLLPVIQLRDGLIPRRASGSTPTG